MSPEQKRGKGLSKSTRSHIRATTSAIRKEIVVTSPAADTTAWNKTVEILRLKLPDFDEKFGPHSDVLRDFFEMRRQIILSGFQQKLITEFRGKHDNNLLYQLTDAFVLIRGIVDKV